MRALFIVGLVGFTAQVFGKLSFSKPPLEYSWDKSTIRIENKLRLDSFFSKNARMLNDDNGDLDKVVIPGRFIDDLVVHHYYRNTDCKWDTVHLKAGIRFKGIFGAPESTLRTAPATTKDLEAVVGSHIHPLPIHIPIVREIWGEFMLNDLLGLSFENQHTFTMGLFPFSLGRGIALGDAYAVAPDFIGYDPATAVDQYAPGLKLSGELHCNHVLDYDLYVAIADNLSDSFNAVNLKTQGQFYGHRFNQARGFGVINYTLAGRLRWTPFADIGNKLYFEPYALFNDERNQKVEVAGDASSKLGTFGLSVEVMRGNFEVGFDIARNLGRQHVKGLDRNVVTKELRPGLDANGRGDLMVADFVNSHVVLVADGRTKVPFNAVTSPGLQAAIDAPIKGTNACSCLGNLNGAVLNVLLHDTFAGTDLPVQNALDRFRDPYVNEFCGTMMVADFAYTIRPGLKFAGTMGYASGDENPNKDLDELNESNVDGTYCGFIGLQEAYSGKRVRSAFLMSGNGKIPRILSYPVNKQINPEVDVPTNEFPTVLSRFTNLGFIGGAVWAEIETCSRRWEINPNILTYWQPHPPRIFDVTTAQGAMGTSAHTHLGTEVNVFVDVTMSPGLKLFLVTGFFVSGRYYDDLKGHPLSRAEKAYLDFVDGTGDPADVTPVLGNDNAFFLNLGIEYRF